MRRTLPIVVTAIVVFGCGRDDSTQSDPGGRRSGGYSSQNSQEAAAPERSTGQPDRASAGDAGVPAADTRPSDQVVSLTGCLEGGEAPAPSRTSSDRTPAASRDAVTEAGAARFLLRRAKPDTGRAGVGANGAGASGGPLVGAASDYVLEGQLAQLRRYVNQEVRVTARVSPTGTAIDQQTTSNTQSTATPGSTASRSLAGDSPATTPPAGTTPNTKRPADNRGAPLRRLLVESVQAVGASCSERQGPSGNK